MHMEGAANLVIIGTYGGTDSQAMPVQWVGLHSSPEMTRPCQQESAVPGALPSGTGRSCVLNGSLEGWHSPLARLCWLH